MAVNAAAEPPRNPGPSWGYGFLLWAERWWPRWFFRPLLLAGVWIGFGCMPRQRTYSREYLRVVLGREPRTLECWGHFRALTDALLLKLRAGRGAPVDCRLQPGNAAAFEALLASDEPALFGTFHFGDSDLLGYLLGARGRKVSIIRQRVGNSTDTRLLGERFGDQVSFLWVNDPANLLFDLKAALETGASLAMKCDRVEFSARAESFAFLGARRLFPFTIYHLAVMFRRPVVFCLAEPGPERNAVLVHASPVFRPEAAADRDAALAAARAHFQAVLAQLEALLRQRPELWFNFLPLNPVAPNAR
jgi:predicted LPLAT superfamily acyltransferase